MIAYKIRTWSIEDNAMMVNNSTNMNNTNNHLSPQIVEHYIDHDT